jgi:hypothetical protein
MVDSMAYIKLFAQPIRMEPRLSQDALEEGVYKVSTKFEKKLSFTDIGETVWKTAKALDKNAKIKASYLSEVEFKWDIHVFLLDLRITLRCARVDRILWKMPRDAFIMIELRGSPETIVEFVQKFVANLGRKPYEISDWRKFKEFTGVSKREVTANWKKIVDI